MKEFQREKLADATSAMNVAELARRAGLRKDTVYRWIMGEHWPQRAKLEKLAAQLSIDPEWFYEPYEDGVKNQNGSK